MAKLPRPFNTWTTYINHRGIDFPVGTGTPIPASGPGVVYSQFNSLKGGFHRYVKYDNGTTLGYFHLRDWAGPQPGTRVSYGQTVAYSGNTGHSLGPHLHLEVESPLGTVRMPPDFWNYVDRADNGYVGGTAAGGGATEINQRVVGPNGVNGRSQPNTQVAVTQTLEPGAVANLDGWINGETVNGNNVWFRGEISGDYFWSGGFNSQSKAGLKDLNVPPPVVLGPQQRKSTAYLNGRAEPNVSAAIVSNLESGTIGDFSGWMRGSVVDGEDRWLRGTHSGGWFTLRYLEPRTVDNLDDLNPVVPPPVVTPVEPERTVGMNPVNVRNLPYTSGTVVRSIPGGTVVKVNGVTTGDSVNGIDGWYRLAEDNYWAWGGGFTRQSSEGLPSVTAPDKPSVPTGPYTFTAFSPVVTEVMPANIQNFENPTSVPDAGKRVGFPADQSHVVLHDYGKDGTDTYAGTVSWFQNPAAKTSAHLVISDDHITQMVSLRDRAWHAGSGGNSYIGIEIDPIVGYTGTDPAKLERKRKTIASVNRALDALRAHYGKATFTYHEHNEFMSTTCGDDIHFEDYPQGGITPPPIEPSPDVVEIPRAEAERFRDILNKALGE